MQCLVIIPTNLEKETFSAPLAWLFAEHANKVQGVYARDLTVKQVQNYDHFIVELNWFTELREFLQIVRFIRRYKPQATILFGGLFSSLKYREIFQMAEVDYFIKGDNELPIKMYLDSVDPQKIPNMVGRNFENEQTYIFSAEEFTTLDYNLDWFPAYLKMIDKQIQKRINPSYGNLLAKKTKTYLPVHYLPSIFTVKSGCLAVHPGCDGCLGTKHQKLRELYGRNTLVLDNDTLISLLKKVSNKFKAVTIFFMSDPDYDFSHEHFDLHATLEFDCQISLEKAREIMMAFKIANATIPLYQEGYTGKQARKNVEKFLEIEDENHKVFFSAFRPDYQDTKIPQNRWIFSELVTPGHACYDVYTNIEAALVINDYLNTFWNRPVYQLENSITKRALMCSNFYYQRIKAVMKLLKHKGDLSAFANEICNTLDRQIQELTKQSTHASTELNIR